MENQQLPAFESARQRRLVEDIASWKYDGADGPLTDDEFDEYIQELSELEMSALQDIWFDTVGQWLLSRHEIGPVDDRDEWLTDQFTAVKTGAQTDYGYVRGVSLPRRKSDP